MPSLSLGDLAAGALLRQQNATLKAEVQRRSAEMTTGRQADVAAANRGDLRPLAALSHALRRLDGLSAAATETGLIADTMQSVLTRLGDTAGSLAPELLNTGSAGAQPSTDVVLDKAARAFDDVIAALNARVADRAVFAGTAPDGAALASAAVILGALETAAAGAVTSGEVAAAVRGWFADPAGFAAVGYLGGDAASAVDVSPHDRVQLDVTALDPGIMATLEGLAIAALADRPVGPGTPDFRAGLAREAGAALVAAQDAVTRTAARLGVAEERIAAAQTRAAAERTALELAVNDLVAADPYDSAARLETAQTRLETLYAVTERLSRLSLVNFLS